MDYMSCLFDSTRTQAHTHTHAVIIDDSKLMVNEIKVFYVVRSGTFFLEYNAFPNTLLGTSAHGR